MGLEIRGYRLAALRGPVVAALLWSALASASMQLRDQGEAVLLIWLPSAVSVAALYATPRRNWWLVLTALAVALVATSTAYGVPLVRALGLAVANAAEATISAAIGLRVVVRNDTPITFRRIAGLFAAAIAGSATSALLAFPFRAVHGLPELAWWFLASLLGILTGTPLLLYLRQRLGFGDHAVRFRRADGQRGFALTVAALFALSAFVFVSPASVLLPVLLPVLVVAVVFAVIRYGQLAAAFGVAAYGVAGTLASTGGRSPAAALAMEPFSAGLVLQALMVLMLAAAMPIAAILLKRDRLEAQLRAQNAELHDNLTILNLAKTLAGIGRWRYNLVTGEQDWSEQMLVLNGLSPDLAPDPGDIRDLLPDRGDALFAKFVEHRNTRIPYTFDYTVRPGGGAERILKMNVFNEFDSKGHRIALFAVAMDVTEQVQREQALRQARERAIALAAEAQKLANTDSLTGLANRRATFDWLAQLLPASLEEGEPLTMLLFDIDHFKAINDTYGHLTGDRVLQHVARVARAEIRAEDLVGRIGGEEFVCLLSGLDARRAKALAERLRRAIAAGDRAGGLPVATISVGLAACRPGDTPELLLARADAALYEAKEAGRNQVRRAA